MDGRTFREAFVRTIMLEISQPERTVNDDLLRGFQAGFDAANGPREMIFVEDNAARIADLYNRLEDQSSKDTLAFLYLNRALGGLHSQAPHLTSEFLAKTQSIRQYTRGKGRRLSSHQWLPAPIYLEEYEVRVDGRTVVLDTHDISALEIFLLDQYSYNGSSRVEASPGDTVIDADACWGDTSLYFAVKVMPGGRVFSFEISQENIVVLKDNLAKNPDLADLVSVISRPLACDSTGYFWSLDNGAASRLAHADNGGTKMRSISIDDFVSDNAIDRVDFIKFDIEGEERNAIDGAVNTIRRDKPSMAVSRPCGQTSPRYGCIRARRIPRSWWRAYHIGWRCDAAP
jgi:FkbM family methyltransferase